MKQDHPVAAFFGINKYSRAGAISTVVILTVLILTVTLNALMGLLPHSVAKPNLTGSDTFRVSATSLAWLETLEKDVTLHLICEGGRARADGDIYSFLLRYEEASQHIHVNVADPASDASFISRFGGEWPEQMSVIVESDERYKIIPYTELFYYYSSLLGSKLTPEKYTETYNYLANLEGGEAYLLQFAESLSAFFDGESRVTNAINYVTREEVPTVYALSGAGAASAIGSVDLDSSLKDLLATSCYDLRTTLTLAALPEDCDLLVINAPTSDLSAEEASALSSYLADGGRLLLTTVYVAADLPNLNAVLKTYGLGPEDSVNVVLEGNANYAMSDSSATYPYFFRAHIASSHAATDDFDGEFLLYYPHSIKLTETEGVTLTPWLYTSAAGYLMTYDEETQNGVQSEEKAVYNVGVIAEKGDTRILWIASPFALTETYNSYSQNGNFTLALSALNWMTDMESDSIAISSRAIDVSHLSVSAAEFLIWTLLLALLIPIAVISIGAVKWYIRKKR